MAKNTKFTLGFTREQLIDIAQAHGKSSSAAKKSSTKRLESYIQNKSNPKKKTSDVGKLGLTRQQLIEAAQVYGRSEKSAKKASTKDLDKLITRQIGGKGTTVPEFNDREINDIKQSATEWGTKDALKLLTYRFEKIHGARDEENFLRLTIARNFDSFISGEVTSEHIDEIISRLPNLGATQVDSDFMRIRGFYATLFRNYANELKEQEQSKVQKEEV